MVVSRPAHFQLRAGIDFSNTELCCKTSAGVEYAGDIMEPRQPDKHRPSDRRLRPRSSCPRCNRLLAANVSTCICSERDVPSRRLPPKPSKVQDTGGTSGNPKSQAAGTAGLQVESLVIQADELSSRSSGTSLENLEDISDVAEQMTAALQRPMTPQPSTSQSSSSHSRLSSEESVLVVDTSTLSKPSTSQMTSETPKRDSFSIVPRRLFPSKSDHVKGFTLVATNTARKSGMKSTKSTVSLKPPSKVQTAKVAVKSKGSSKVLSPPSTSSLLAPGTSTEADQVLAGSSRSTPEMRVGAEPGSSQRIARHTCPECGKSFTSPGKLAQHMFVHTGERPFSCTQCSKAFSSKFKLVRHNLIHSSERRFNCTSCERQFHRKDHLQNHSKIHDAVKLKFVCERPDCGKEYGSANSARKHSAAHAAQDGNLECALCNRTFSSTPEVLHHLKIHAGSRAVKTPADRKFRCDHCERRFFTRKDVRRHLVVHTGLRDFLCQFCPQRFGRKDHLVRHIKKSHQGGRLKARKRAPRRQPPRNPIVLQTPEETTETGPEPTEEILFKVEDETISFPSTSGIKQEMSGFSDAAEALKEDADPLIPLYPPPPYPKAAELPQYYQIDPEIQKLFTSETDNGNLLMHLMDTVELAESEQVPEMEVLMPATAETSGEAIAEEATLNEQFATMIGEGENAPLPSFGESQNAPLPGFSQAFPQPPQ